MADNLVKRKWDVTDIHGTIHTIEAHRCIKRDGALDFISNNEAENRWFAVANFAIGGWSSCIQIPEAA